MNEEIDEYDIYHQDFTTVSSWEVFIARIEEVLNDWRLSKENICDKVNHVYTKKWIAKSENVDFQGQTYTLSYHSLESGEKTVENEVDKSPQVKSAETCNPLQIGMWEASRKFLDDFDGGPFPVSHWFGLKHYIMLCPLNEPLVHENTIKLVMSSVNIAFANVDCAVPFFVKIREHWQQCFWGLYEDNEFRTSFDTTHLKRIPNHCSHLNGICNLFKGKIASPIPLDPVLISAKFSYELIDFEPFAWQNSSVISEFLSIDGFEVMQLTDLPFGCTKNPIKNALLNVIWPKFLETAVIDCSSFSEFDPLMAPTWTITLKYRENLKCLLSELIRKVLDLFDNENLLMDTLGLSKSLGLVNPLNKITEPQITISKLVKAAMGNTSVSTAEFKGPIADELLMPILYYIFPDATEDSTFKYPENIEIQPSLKLCGAVKGSAAGGLAVRAAAAAARLLDAGGLPYLAHLWYELTQELNYRWEHRQLVPGVAAGAPNARTCLLHQKLQMLNCCILKAKEVADGAGGEGSSSEEEFFDCSDEGDDRPTTGDRPAGRLRRLDNACLKNGAPLYVPVTQDPAPKTEDQIEEDSELLVRLGEDARGAELRARMMNASLLSDMEAFRAANPGAELCDFVQWYSPRDWEPAGGGALGPRMLLPGNPWAETWAVARAVPAQRQRRLFDARREAERVLRFLRGRSAAGVAELLLPPLLRAGAAVAVGEGAADAGGGAAGADRRRALELAARELQEAERAAMRARAARRVLQTETEGAALGAAGRARLLGAAGGRLPPPTLREFSLRVRSAAAPQLLRAQLGEDILLVGAFTERIAVF